SAEALPCRLGNSQWPARLEQGGCSSDPIRRRLSEWPEKPRPPRSDVSVPELPGDPASVASRASPQAEGLDCAHAPVSVVHTLAQFTPDMIAVTHRIGARRRGL